jgi:hypothetical protein
MNRVGLVVTGLLAVWSLILTIQKRLEQRIATLLDCLEKKGALTAEDRAAIGLHPPRNNAGTFRGVLRLLLAVLGGLAVLFALLFFFAACSGTR